VVSAAFTTLLKHQPVDERQFLRRMRRVLDDLPMPSPAPRGVKITKTTVANEPSVPPGVPGTWLLPPGEPRMTLVYLHGGAFIGGQLATYHGFCGQLAKRLQARVFLADYRLAPENPYPAAVDDAMAAYMALAADYPDEPLVVGGDSAGGGLTLSLLLRLRDESKRPGAKKRDCPRMPICAFALSPVADLTGRLPSRRANGRRDAMLNSAMADMATDMYLAGHSATDPHASPAYGNFKELPPLWLAVSEEEILRDDAYLVASKARRAGGVAELIARQGLPHVWPVFYWLIPEARQDTALLADFIGRQYLEAQANPPPRLATVNSAAANA
jgi:acetyl esterase/lipase